MSEVTTQFINFDYKDDKGFSSEFKEAILYAIRIQKVFDRIGYIDITPEVTAFFDEPILRKKLEEMVKDRTKVKLSSPELPFLMRAKLVEAYFNYKIAKHLEQPDNIEIALPESLRDIIAKPFGYEVIESLKNKLKKEEKEKLEDIIRKAQSSDISRLYDIAFDGEFSRQPTSDIYKEVAETLTKAIIPKTTPELTEANLGGKDVISALLFMHAKHSGAGWMLPREEAESNDILRIMFQEDGMLGVVGDYNTIKLRREKYKEMSPSQKKFVHKYLIENLFDAQKIRQAMILFPGELDSSLAQQYFAGFVEGKQFTGVKIETEDKQMCAYFDNDKKKDLKYIAMGAQYLLEAYAGMHKKSLVHLNMTSLSDKERSKANVSLFAFFEEYQKEGGFYEGDLKEITASNTFEFFGIPKDGQEEFYKAYLRLFSTEGFMGKRYEHSDKFNLKISKDGQMTAQHIDDMEDEHGQEFDPIAKAKGEGEVVENYRRFLFESNMEKLGELIKNEIENHKIVVDAIDFETKGECPIRVDSGLYMHVRMIEDTKRELAGLNEKIVVLMPFVQVDYKEYMGLLGLSDLESKKQVSKQFQRKIIQERAHPDAASNPQEEIEKAEMLGKLITARDQLLHALEFDRKEKSGVTTYLSNISQMLKSK